MLMYKAIRYFTDLEDHSYPYNSGDVFPRDGLRVSKKRIEDLLTGNNRKRLPMIELVEDTEEETVTETVEEKTVEEKVEETPVEKPKPKRGRKKKNAD